MPCKQRLALASLLLLSFGSATAQSQPINGDLQPTEVLHLMVQEMMNKPEKPQPENTRKFLPRARTAGLSRQERFVLGELYFLAFMPQEAKAVYQGYLDADDLIARTAWQRVMQIRFAAEDKPAEVEKNIVEYRRRFPPTPEDYWGLYQQIGNLAQLYIAQGNDGKAAALVRQEVERLPFDAPYASFLLLARHFEAFQKIKQAEDARALMEKVRAGLQATLDRAGYTPAKKPSPPDQSLPHRPGVYHRPGEGLRADEPDFDPERYRLERMAFLVERLQAALDQARTSD